MKGITERKEFNVQYNFKDEADEGKNCRKCNNFRRHPDLITFCHYLFGILTNKSDSRVWGKNGCDRFKVRKT
jgi:hypothetical protein